MRTLLLAAPLATLTLLLAACGSESTTGPDDQRGPHDDGGSSGQSVDTPDGPPSATLDDELPWEVVSEQGESLLPNVFYADPSQNEQVMPHTLTNGHAQIDRLVYPTLGNPNLYVRDDDADSLMLVLRIEEAALAHLSPQVQGQVPRKKRSYMTLSEDDKNFLAVYLVDRQGRLDYTALQAPVPGVREGRIYAIRPSEIQVDPNGEDVPERLRSRRTVRLIFRKDALSHVPAALYDLRFEVLKDSQLHAAPTPLLEWQYNAVRIFDTAEPEYTVINVTDTQLSMSDVGTGSSRAHLRRFVGFVNEGNDPMLARAPFITFNGDLHNGGSVLTFRQRAVANTYREEATYALETLRDLTKPIFLTTGNHDGYAATGKAPDAIVSADNTLGTILRHIPAEAGPSAWPNYDWDDYAEYLAKIEGSPDGFHNDIFVGSFRRRSGARTFASGWNELPLEQRNMVLYDGFHQWQRTYGPLNYSFQYGKNHYISMNSAELRQHTRSGWGMFIVNYGGGLSPVQEEWLRRTVAAHPQEDIVLMAHHDPRGGHDGIDPGYYFTPLKYRGVQQSIANYLLQEVVNPATCGNLPRWARSVTTNDEECLHDGLQEWMAPDLQFDCAPSEQDDAGNCRAELFADPDAHAYRFNAYQLVDLIARTPNLRTMVLGHTHKNTLEVLQSGQAMVPVSFTDAELQGFASLEVQNPTRGYAWQSELSGQAPADYDPNAVEQEQMLARMRQLRALYDGAAARTTQTLSGDARELVVMRSTTAANLTSQSTVNGDKSVGFSVYSVLAADDKRTVSVPQINRIRFMRTVGERAYSVVGDLRVPRTVTMSMQSHDNPLRTLYDIE